MCGVEFGVGILGGIGVVGECRAGFVGVEVEEEVALVADEVVG